MMTQIPAEEKWEGAGGGELRDMCKGSRGVWGFVGNVHWEG